MILSLALLLLVPQAAQQQPPANSPEEAVRKMTVPEGFEVTLFAGEPDVVQPMSFAIDDRGRVWVAENLNYETRGSDTYKLGPLGRIAILEDTDGDGRFDKRKVFIEKIYFPSGLEVGHGGVWVGSPPNFLFIPDKDGDDVPDSEPKIILDGWGRQDRHETLNSFMWGPDGWLYGCHGVFTFSKVGKPGAPDAERQEINAGVFRYHPVKDKFEVFAWGTSNPWGMDFDDHGQMFITACVIPHLWHMVQGGRYHRQGGKHFGAHVYDDIKTIADHSHQAFQGRKGGFAHGGCRVYLGDSFPPEWRGKIVMGNIHHHLLYTDTVERKGSGFVGRHGGDLLVSNDEQFLGFNLEIGPEGAVYIIDWNDADICGKKVFQQQTGRVFRLAAKGTKAVRPLDVSKLPDDELVKLQLHANDWQVRHARRVLQERAVAGKLGKGTTDALRKILDDNRDATRRLRALWALHVTGGVKQPDLRKLLDDADEHVRAWAIQLLCEDRDAHAAAVHKMADMATTEKSAVVRLYLASACQRIAPADRRPILDGLMRREEDAGDHNIPLMIWYALEPLVAADKSQVPALVASCKIPKVREFIARRAAAN